MKPLILGVLALFTVAFAPTVTASDCGNTGVQVVTGNYSCSGSGGCTNDGVQVTGSNSCGSCDNNGVVVGLSSGCYGSGPHACISFRCYDNLVHDAD